MTGKLSLTVLGLGLALLALVLLRAPAAENVIASESHAPTDLQTLIETHIDSGHTLVFHFDEPLFPGENFLEASAGRVYAGSDYVCITERWNDDTRHRCTPFHNLISVSFITPGRP